MIKILYPFYSYFLLKLYIFPTKFKTFYVTNHFWKLVLKIEMSKKIIRISFFLFLFTLEAAYFPYKLQDILCNKLFL